MLIPANPFSVVSSRVQTHETEMHTLIPQGVPSLIFHLSDRGGGDLNIVGPPGIDAYMASIRTFVNRRHPAQHIFQLSSDSEKKESTFKYSTADHDPAPFAWAQGKTPGAGLEIVAFPYSAVLKSRAEQTRGGVASREDARCAKRPRLAKSRDVAPMHVAYVFVMRGPCNPRHAEVGYEKSGEETAGRRTATAGGLSVVVVVDCVSCEAADHVVQVVGGWLKSHVCGIETSNAVRGCMYTRDERWQSRC